MSVTSLSLVVMRGLSNGSLCLLILLVQIGLNYAGLYDEFDDVIILNKNNFDETIVGSNNAWIVEFYNSWCGHCIRFAPLWKSLASDCRGWQKLLKVAAMDCSEKENLDICMHYDIQMYPTLTYFPAASSSRPPKLTLDSKHSTDELKIQMIDFVSNHSLSNLTPQQSIFLSPLRKLSDAWLKTDLLHEDVVIIYEAENSYLGREIILDLYDHVNSPFIGRIVSNNLTIVNPPSSYLLTRDGPLKPLIKSANKSDHMNKISLLKIKTKETELQESLQKTNINEHVFDFTSNRQLPVSSHSMKNDSLDYDDTNIDWQSDSYTKLHENDLISALMYSLRHEIPLQGHLSPDNVDIALDYLRVLVKFLPIRASLITGLEKLIGVLEQKKTQKDFIGLSGEDWIEILKQSIKVKFYPDEENWISCKGSSEWLRGYPCGLWATFHSVTVNAAQIGEDADCIQVLLSVKNYINIFLGCEECKTNFIKGTIKIKSQIKSCNQAVIFLWRSHNKANIRLRGDPSEDPKHPKTVFPNKYQCPSCRVLVNNAGNLTSFSGLKDGWDEREVLKFLTEMYGHSGIVDVQGPMNLWLSESASIIKQKYPKTFLNSVSYVGVVNVLNHYDVGMCMAFYMMCILLIVGLYLHFIRKKKLCLISVKSKHLV